MTDEPSKANQSKQENTTSDSDKNQPSPESIAPISVSRTPTSRGAIKMPSMADIKAGTFQIKKEEETEAIQIDLPKNTFTEDAFMNAWEECVKIITKKGQASLNVMMNRLKPSLIENCLCLLTFSSAIEQQIFEREKVVIAGFLRETLQNYEIDFKVEISQNTENEIPYTNLEKFKSMSEKNPMLSKLKDHFGLDVN